MNRIYACIDLKSFYASVECIERNLDPLTTNLVVADNTRTEKTICLAVSPSLKQYGLSGRARLFEVVNKLNEANYNRKKKNKNYKFIGKSYDDNELKNNNNLEIDYIIAPPRMSYYMKYSKSIYNIYLKYISEEDIYVYSIDEVFCDITDYLKYNNVTPREFVTKMIHDVYKSTGITATAGIGTNMYLAKVAMDIVAKHSEPDNFGVRMSELDEMSYRKLLWDHKPITSFWRVGKGYAKKLENYGIYTMGDIARCSIDNEEQLYKLFGVNAETLIDHAWGYEPVTMKIVKSFKPERNSISSGQVLHCPYDYENSKLIVKEMADLLSLDLVKKGLETSKLILTLGYDIENLKNSNIRNKYTGEIVIDMYGRSIPKHSHGTINIDYKTSSSITIIEKATELYEKIVNKNLLIKRINIVADDVTSKNYIKDEIRYEQTNLFTDYKELEIKRNKQKIIEEKDNELQKVLLDLKSKYGKNSILKAMNLEKTGTTIYRNKQIGGHRE